MINNVDHRQSAPFWAVWYRFVLSIMQTYLSRLLERVQYLIVYKHVIGISGFFCFFFDFFLLVD